MQTSYLRFFWLQTIKLSIARKKLIVKVCRPLLQFLVSIGKQLPLCDRIIDCFLGIPAPHWADKSSNQSSVPSDFQQMSHLKRNSSPVFSIW
jgi:hypothetical protein